ncbi:E3 ubiquitin-protein ligase MARCH7 [Hypanus sabinus]|uniref:E3 ubiquitin-protein ligase MARCH7 n=1 Tax=Hypanus sabinus TaxID=79690 RepID=UPI0028C38982|nr:E3 ubiquitin-protein ligase MARCH7 [Hypanus sabinus]
MDPKPSRIPRKVSAEVHNTSASSSEAKMLYEDRLNVLDDFYATREGEKQEAEFQPILYNEADTLPGAPSGFFNPSENSDYKRPKLVSSCSSNNNANCFSNCSDSIWENQFPRSQIPFNSTSRTEAALCKETKMERTASSHGEGFGRVLSSYAQGARPRETLLGSLRRTTSSLSQALSSSSGSPSTFSRDSRNSSRSFDSNSCSTGVGIMQRSVEGGFVHRAETSESERNTSLLHPRPLNNFASESSNSRCRPRQLLSRLASSMSSTFSGSRISNWGHSSTRSLERANTFQQSNNASCGERPENLAQPSAIGRTVNNFSQNQSPETSEGFGFLRWRRPGPSTALQSQNFSMGQENLSPDDSENSNTSSWLSSLQSRYTLSRREGRDETAASSCILNEAREEKLPIPQRAVGAFQNSSSEQSDVVRGAAAPLFNGFPSPIAGSSTQNAAPETFQTRNTAEFREVLSNSFICLSMPCGPEHDFSDVLIAVDFVHPTRGHSEQEKQQNASTSSKDPEKLRKIQESLLLEDSDDDEEDICRICQVGARSTSSNPLLKPCNCTGSLQYVHQECIKKWLQSKINSGADLTAVITCELCKEKLQLDLEDFDVHELYRTHEQAQRNISSGLYLVLLLHLCEQRFSEIMGGTSESRTRLQFIHLARTLQQHIQDLETTDEDSEDEQDRFESRTPRSST